MPFILNFKLLNCVYTHFCIWKIRWWTHFCDQTNGKKNLIFDAKLVNSENPNIKWVWKSIHHYVLVWDKEIPHSDQNNFVRNEALIVLILWWNFLVPHQYIWRILLVPSLPCERRRDVTEMSLVMRKPVFALREQQRQDQPAHQRSLISTFVVRFIDIYILLVSISEISSLYLASVAAKAGLCLHWSQILKTSFLVMRLKYWWFRC